jgi:hypothetical protein
LSETADAVAGLFIDERGESLRREFGYHPHRHSRP